MLSHIKLNFGIKRFIRSIPWRIDTFILLPVWRSITQRFVSQIIRHYGADYRWGDEKSQNIEKKTNNLGYGLFHYSFIRNMKPKRILCIGSMYGYIPFMMTRACQDNTFGHVDFVDAGFDMKSSGDKHTHYFGQGFWARIDWKRHFSYLLDFSYITFYQLTSQDFAKQSSHQYDYIYLDGDHSYEGAVQDLRLFWKRLNKNGFLCFHDIHFKKNLEGVKFEFWKIWEDLAPMPYKFEVSNNYSGLGIIQKKNQTSPITYLRK